MNEIQAINILTNLATEATKNGLFKDINESGAVYTALLVLSQRIPQPEEPQKMTPALGPDDAGYHVSGDEVGGEGDPQTEA